MKSNLKRAVDTPLEVRESPTEGRGAFAARPIARGERLMPVTGRRVTSKDVDINDHYLPLLQVDDDLFFMGEGGSDDFINHSCTPNVAVDPKLMIYALRDIGIGEELFYDYSTFEIDPEWSNPCLCGADNCRGTLTGFAALKSEDQRRLLPFALPYIQRRFAGRIP